MRPNLAFNVLGVLTVGVASVQAQSRTTLSGLSRRQTGGYTDTCGLVIGELQGLVNGNPITFGEVYACACLSTISSLLTSNGIAAELNERSETCTFPAGAIESCEDSNPCAFACSNGFSVDSVAGECVCEAPNAVCNGQCSSSCPSAVVTPERRAASPFDRVANRRRMCPRGFIPCGLFEQRGQVSEPWECVDAKHELESCGGCMTPFDSLSPRGVDCTALPGVADVSCMGGACVVRRCKSGYAVTADRSRCVATK
uniref:Cytochrome P450 monooxygenase CYP52X1 n=1 Tax=Ganoderma boninense TaxID=34458 RepID=A0A5K1K104_9APHY|nr:Cytochrome P450 monooxygenase CYP52X1 [Ganoderma boninense]